MSRTNNSVLNQNSRYVHGGTTTRRNTRNGWWERKILEKSDTDITITIEPNEDRRPDIMAFRLYDDPKLAWLILQFNNIVDTETEFTTGKEILVPTARRVQLDILTQPTGGERV